MSTTESIPTPEQIVSNYVETFCLMHQPNVTTNDYTIATKMTPEGPCINISADQGKNGGWNEVLSEAFTALGNDLRDTHKFELKSNDMPPPMNPQDQKTQHFLGRAYDAFMGPRLYGPQEPHLIVLDMHAENIQDSLTSLVEKTREMQAAIEEKTLTAQEQKMDRALERLTLDLPASPQPQVITKTIQGLGKLAGELSQKYDVPETVAIGAFTEQLQKGKRGSSIETTLS